MNKKIIKIRKANKKTICTKNVPTMGTRHCNALIEYRVRMAQTHFSKLDEEKNPFWPN